MTLRTLRPRVEVIGIARVTTGTRRIRGRALQTRRATWFRYHPLCVLCETKGRVSAAIELDHVIPLSKGGRDDESNIQGLCIDCHEEKTRSERAGGEAES